MSTAEVVDFPVSEVKKVADLDNGYTRIANDLLEALYSSNLTERQFKIVMFIMRKTYGFNKKSDYIANTQIGEAVGVHHTHICKSKIDLIDRKILILDGRKIGINKNVSEWVLAKSAKVSQIGKSLAKSANKILAESANGYYPNQLNTKDNITKEKKDNKKIYKKEISPKAKKTNFPDDLIINEANKKLANDLGLNAEFEFNKFKDRNLSIGGQYVNWDSAFSNWLRRAFEFKGGKSNQSTPKQKQMTPEQQAEYEKYMFMQGLS